jgi:hypothetical protein
MYAVYTRRKMNPPRAQETLDRAESEFFPRMRQAPGFVSFTLIRGEDGVNLAIVLFESKTQAEAFRTESAGWWRTLDEFGHGLESQGAGEVIQHITARE